MPAPTDPAPIAVPTAMRTLLAGHDATPATAGESGAVVVRFHAPGHPTRYLKSGRGAIAEAIAEEHRRLTWLGGRAAAPAVVAFAQQDDAAFLLTTAVAGTSAFEQLASSTSDAESIAAALGRHLRIVHALPVADCPFDADPVRRLAVARRNIAAGLVDPSDFDADHAGMTPDDVHAAVEALLPLPFARVVTHGDYSLDNVLVDGDAVTGFVVTGCIDWGRAGLSDPYQDIAIAWRDLGEFGAPAQAAFLRACGVDEADHRRLAFFRALDELF